MLGELLSLFKDSAAEKGFINVSPCDHLGMVTKSYLTFCLS